MHPLYFLTLLPIIWLIFALIKLKMQGYLACLTTLALTLALAIPFWKMPILDAATSTLEGAVAAFWPIFIIILGAMFVYDMAIKNGSMDTIKHMLASVSDDRRILVLIICWGFGGFMEGMAGFGTAVAIPAAMLVALDMNPITAAAVAIINNAFPTAFGAVGIPTTTAAAITGLDPIKTASAIAVQSAPFMILVPFILVIIAGGSFKALKGMLPIILVAILSFTVPEILVAKFIGSELALTVGSIISLVAMITLLKIYKPKTPEQYRLDIKGNETPHAEMGPIKSWLPFIFILVLLLLTSKLFPVINGFLAQFSSVVKISTAATAKPLTLTWINQPGVWIILSTIAAALIQGSSPKMIAQTFAATFKRMLKTMYTMMAVIAIAKVMTYSGMITDMALLFVALTGPFYPFIAPIIGALGAFVTGSGTNSQVLFSPLQFEIAQKLGKSTYWMIAANETGAGLGKVISPQCLAIVVAATGLAGKESEILKAVFKWILLLLILLLILVGFAEKLLMPLI